ncbi:MAG: lipase family protein [Acidimicrobiales bacterium]
MRTGLRLLACATVIGIVLAGCSSKGALATGSDPNGVARSVNVSHDYSAFYRVASPLPAGAPGSLIRGQVVTGVPGVPAGATAWRILYHSRSIYNRDMAVSGYVIVPSGPVPPGGRTVVSWTHGTTGITPECNPSHFDTGGPNRPYLVPDLAAFLRAGYIVAATDYPDPGGLQPYLLGESEGRSVLDATRASHHLPAVHASATTLIYGHSQGGHAALFAGEIAPTYAPDLKIAGVVAAAPATNLSLILSLVAGPAGQGALAFEMYAAWSWSHTYNDLPAADFFTPAASAQMGAITSGCLTHTVSVIAKDHLTVSQVFVPSAATNPVVVAHARMNDPGRVHTDVPMLVVQGTADTTVPPALTDLYVQKMACPIGDKMDYLKFRGVTHGQIPTAAAPTILAWMSGRLHPGSGSPVTCGLPGDARTVTPGSTVTPGH